MTSFVSKATPTKKQLFFLQFLVEIITNSTSQDKETLFLFSPMEKKLTSKTSLIKIYYSIL